MSFNFLYFFFIFDNKIFKLIRTMIAEMIKKFHYNTSFYLKSQLKTLIKRNQIQFKKYKCNWIWSKFQIKHTILLFIELIHLSFSN